MRPRYLGKPAFIIFAVLISALCGNVAAQTIVPIVGDDRAKPKNWLDENGEPVGIMIDILKEVSKRSDLEFTFRLAPWKRAYHESEAGRGAIIGFSKTSERQKHWHYSDPMYYDELVLVTTKVKSFEYNGLKSLNGRRLAVKLGARYGDEFNQAIQNGYFKLVETTDRAGQMRMLVEDRTDVLLISPGKIALEAVISENGWLKEHRSEFVILQPPVKLDPNFLGVPKSMNMEHIIPIFNRVFEEIRQDSTYDKIVVENIQKAIASIN